MMSAGRLSRRSFAPSGFLLSSKVKGQVNHLTVEQQVSLVERYVVSAGRVPRQRGCFHEGYDVGELVCSWVHKWIRGKLPMHHAASISSLPGWSWPRIPFDTVLIYANAFFEANGRLPSFADTHENQHVGKWLGRARLRALTGNGSPEMVAALENLPGWTWARKFDMWNCQLLTLISYFARHGRVPTSWISHNLVLDPAQTAMVPFSTRKESDISNSLRFGPQISKMSEWSKTEYAGEVLDAMCLARYGTETTNPVRIRRNNGVASDSSFDSRLNLISQALCQGRELSVPSAHQHLLTVIDQFIRDPTEFDGILESRCQWWLRHNIIAMRNGKSHPDRVEALKCAVGEDTFQMLSEMEAGSKLPPRKSGTNTAPRMPAEADLVWGVKVEADAKRMHSISQPAHHATIFSDLKSLIPEEPQGRPRTRFAVPQIDHYLTADDIEIAKYAFGVLNRLQHRNALHNVTVEVVEAEMAAASADPNFPPTIGLHKNVSIYSNSRRRRLELEMMWELNAFVVRTGRLPQRFEGIVEGEGHFRGLSGAVECDDGEAHWMVVYEVAGANATPAVPEILPVKGLSAGQRCRLGEWWQSAHRSVLGGVLPEEDVDLLRRILGPDLWHAQFGTMDYAEHSAERRRIAEGSRNRRKPKSEPTLTQVPCAAAI
eukprot:TRINITY_DN57202_c0_g1_i1.p1 TRINITY_DN57202_c0_g1~~TRINITY_DN57202_c0_g1_i1.p1  ORF type:complete len:659 (+),score=6.17 TRINITY_DN57202_c0_g1_i1:41-2017(+)